MAVSTAPVEPDWDRVRQLTIGEEGFSPAPYDDNRAGPLRRLDRSEVTRAGWRYLVNATGGTATIGYGDTRPEIIDRYWDRDMTEAEALAVFEDSIRGYWEQGVKRWLTRDLATPLQGAALTSFAYNCGVNALPIEGNGQGYTTAPGLLRALNEGRWVNAAELLEISFLKKPEFDLSNRRRREAAVFSEPWTDPAPVVDWWAAAFPVLAAA